MKKYLFILLSTIIYVSCSSDNEGSDNSSRLDNTYQKLKSGISGTWVMDGYHNTHRITNAYQTLGWEEDLYWWQKEAIYILTFSSDGQFSDNKANTSTYSIYVDENQSVDHGVDNDNFYWPFKIGAIYLKFDGDMAPSYYNPYFAEIKSDGRLYLYNTVATLGGEGVPEYRFKKQ